MQIHIADQYYIDNIKQILHSGFDDFGQKVRPKWKDGTPAHTKFILNVQEKYDIGAGEFPFSILRNTAARSGIGEILWIYRDASNDLDLLRSKYGVTWWDEWDMGDRTIGPCYGATVNNWGLMDKLLNDLRNNPFSRRHIMSLWQAADLQQPHGLDPCCFMTTWQVTGNENDLTLHLKLEQRSNDYIMAGYINKIQYVALMMVVARELGMKLGTFTHAVSNLHIYDRHFWAAEEILERAKEDRVLNNPFQPKLMLRGGANWKDVMPDDFIVVDYEPLGQLSKKLEIAV
ncbi:MAG: thymidylate synthase [Candidatus Nanosyncoccaceae bacterium]|jgi:thymidylate synthase